MTVPKISFSWVRLVPRCLQCHTGPVVEVLAVPVPRPCGGGGSGRPGPESSPASRQEASTETSASSVWSSTGQIKLSGRETLSTGQGS